MKLQLTLGILIVATVLILDVSASEKRKTKKFHHKSHHKQLEEDKLNEQDRVHMNEHARKDAEAAENEHRERELTENDIFDFDPCAHVKCSAGQICNIDENNKAECVCIPVCPNENDPRRKVCTNTNETWGSDCLVHQQRCYCQHGEPGCKGEQYKHFHIDYYGECRQMPECKEDELVDFPRRMRDWLFNIMLDLAERRELNKHFMKMEKEAENNQTRRWLNAAIWKWCDLDRDDDRSVSRHELFPIRAPLLSLEHCIAPFLESCDTDGNHRITLKEWGKCLDLEEGDLEAKCSSIVSEDEDDEDED